MKKEEIGIILPKETVSILLDGAKKFIVPIPEYDLKRMNKGYSIGDAFPLWEGDTFYVKEPYTSRGERKYIYYEFDYPDANTFDNWCEYAHTTNYEALKMPLEFSRIKEKVKKVKIIKVQETLRPSIKVRDAKVYEKWSVYHRSNEPIYQKRGRGFRNYLKLLNIDYEDNPFVFEVTLND